MDKTVLLAVSFYKKSYYFNNEFSKLPKVIQEEIRIACTLATEKTRGIITVGFCDNGAVYVESSGDETDFDYDEIGARLVVDALIEEKSELIKSISLWYKVVKGLI